MTRLAVSALLLLTGCATTPDFTPASPPGVKRGSTLAGTGHPAAARKRHPSGVSRSRQRRPVTLNWSALAACESTNRWHADTGNGYYGGVQMGLAFWRNYGGLSFAARPDLATRAEQIVVAERGLAVQGVGAWPTCGIYLRRAA